MRNQPDRKPLLLDEIDPPAAGRTGAVGRLLPAAVFLLAAVVLLAGGRAGLQLRTWAWEASTDIRFKWDIQNGLNWGGNLLAHAQRLAVETRPDATARDLTPAEYWAGYVSFYDHVVASAPDGNYGLDYAPLRLLTMSLWTRNVHAEFAEVRRFKDEYAPPLLTLNTAMGIASAAGALALTYFVLRRAGRSRHMSALGASIASVLLFTSPSMIADAHVWPQWDVWLLPGFLWGTFAAVRRHWLAAGVLVALAAMLKGQILFVAPLFVLWPLFRGQFTWALRFGVGFATGSAVVASPWLVADPLAELTPWLWLGGLLLAAGVLLAWPPQRRAHWTWWVAAAACVGLIVWPWLSGAHVGGLFPAIGLAAAVAAAPWLLRRNRPAVFAWLSAVFVAGVLFAADRYDGSWAWYQIGFAYPNVHYEVLAMGPTSNLPAILAQHFGWQLKDVVFTLPLGNLAPPFDVKMKTLLAVAYAVTLLLCGQAAAAHDRAASAGLLLAVGVPWLLAFTLLPQMHERYLVWAAWAGCCFAILGVGHLLLHAAVSLLAFVMIWHQLIAVSRQAEAFPMSFAAVQGSHPGIGWALVVLAGVALYMALVPPRQKASSTT
ncbi:MAG: hypothetical protein ACFCVE_00385 [Phycisphaerae bacterium]